MPDRTFEKNLQNTGLGPSPHHLEVPVSASLSLSCFFFFLHFFFARRCTFRVPGTCCTEWECGSPFRFGISTGTNMKQCLPCCPSPTLADPLFLSHTGEPRVEANPRLTVCKRLSVCGHGVHKLLGKRAHMQVNNQPVLPRWEITC